MRSDQEMHKRLQEAVQARRALLAEEMEAKKNRDPEGPDESEVAEDIAHLTGVIMTLEWVLESGAGIEYERFKK